MYKSCLMPLIVFCCLLNLMSCSRQSAHQAQGYIEGRYTYIASPVSGKITSLLVERGMRVKQADILAVLEGQPESEMYLAALENYQAAIAARNATVANLIYAKKTFQRYKILVPKNAIQQSQLDNAASIYYATDAQLAQADAQIASLKATLAQTAWTKSQKTLVAPVNAIVFDVYYRLGEYTIASQPIISLLAPQDIKVIFYVSERHLSQLQLGEKVTVNCDGCHPYQAQISFISPSAEYTPPVIFSNETKVKLIYRIEARFSTQEAYQLHPGQPVSVSYGK